MTRDNLIQVAHLLGSDYTEGLVGVGPVTALEILGEFQTLDAFRDWWQGVQMGTISKADDAISPFRKKFRKNAAKIFLPPVFPDSRVALAYAEPEVDSDPQAFQWGVPDLDALRSFLMSTIGWTQERTDEVLVPVIRDMNRRADEGTQANITSFFDGGVGVGARERVAVAGGEAFAPRKRVEGSKRMGTALGRLAQKSNSAVQSAREGSAANIVGEMGDATDLSSADVPVATSKVRKGKERTSAEEESGSEFERPRKTSRKRSAPGKRSQQPKRKRVADDE